MKKTSLMINFIKNTLKPLLALSILSLIASSQMNAQTVVSSIAALQPYLDDDNVNVKLSPGTYTITAAYANSIVNNSERTIGSITSKAIFYFEGNNSTYDFTGVTINMETEVLKAFGSSYYVYEIHIVGSDNVLTNLTLADVGDLDDNPSNAAISIVMDGQRNRIEGFDLSVRGSYPYGYGDAFGKGGSPIIGHYKHSACLVRGDSNHVKDCVFIHQSYGHAIFMQAALDPLIEYCYVEGELRTTNDMLTEEGTGSPADNVGFITAWGYKLPGGYTMSLAEDGIRTYNSGSTTLDGVTTIDRGTTNPTILDCTVKNMRGGVKITDSGGTKLIQGCTVINCEVGYASGTGSIIDSKGDANVGPLLSFVYENGSYLNADITVLPSGSSNNGSGTLAYIGGSNHNITFRGVESDTNPDQNLQIKVSGDLNTIRHLYGNLDYQNTHDTQNSIINNFTGYPIVLADACSNSTVQSCTPVTDNGSGNSVTYSSDCTSMSTSTGVNLALSGTASQSSNNYTNAGLAQLAIDGNTDGVFGNSSVTHTQNNSNAWWQVDLGSDIAIGDINIFNRTDCCESRLSNFVVSVINSSGITTYSETFTTYPDPSTSLSAGNAVGRIVRVQLYGANFLSLAEVEVYAGVNLALSGTASQSSDNYTNAGQAQLAIDGNTDGVFGNSSVTHTQNNSNAWWQVDLGSDTSIGDINIFNRTDCCESRLSNFVVSVINSSGITTYSETFTTYPDPSTSLSAGNAVGRIVRVQLYGANFLSLAEVEVYAGVNTSKKVSLKSTSVDNFDITAYPNPFTSSLTIDASNTSEAIGSIQLVDLLGRVIVSENKGNTISNLDDINSGLYLVMILNLKGEILSVQKVLKK